MERWRSAPIKGYEVSDYGRVRSLDREEQFTNRWGTVSVRIRKGSLKRPTLDKDGYLQVHLFHKSKAKGYRVSRLVLETFDRPPLPGEEALHKNHDKTDNSLLNLKWGSRQDNEDDKTSSGRRPDSTRGVLSREVANRVRELYATGEYTQGEVGRIVGCTHSNVSCIVRGITWR